MDRNPARVGLAAPPRRLNPAIVVIAGRYAAPAGTGDNGLS